MRTAPKRAFRSCMYRNASSFFRFQRSRSASKSDLNEGNVVSPVRVMTSPVSSAIRMMHRQWEISWEARPLFSDPPRMLSVRLSFERRGGIVIVTHPQTERSFPTTSISVCRKSVLLS